MSKPTSTRRQLAFHHARIVLGRAISAVPRPSAKETVCTVVVESRILNLMGWAELPVDPLTTASSRWTVIMKAMAGEVDRQYPSSKVAQFWFPFRSVKLIQWFMATERTAAAPTSATLSPGI
jgi:hypothetical protein